MSLFFVSTSAYVPGPGLIEMDTAVENILMDSKTTQLLDDRELPDAVVVV